MLINWRDRQCWPDGNSSRQVGGQPFRAVLNIQYAQIERQMVGASTDVGRLGESVYEDEVGVRTRSRYSLIVTCQEVASRWIRYQTRGIWSSPPSGRRSGCLDVSTLLTPFHSPTNPPGLNR
ncbi:hypothetical protein CBL_01215 [Carabus blaptoides fortunei]